MKFCLSLKHTKANISLNLQSCRFMYQAVNNNYFWKLWSEEGIERRKVSLWTLHILKKWWNSRWLFRHFFLVVSYNFQIRWNIFKNKLWSLCVLSQLSHVRLLVTLWTIAHQAPLSLGFSRQEYRSGLPCPPPGDLPDPGIEPVSLRSLAPAGKVFTTSATWEAQVFNKWMRPRLWGSVKADTMNAVCSRKKDVFK